MNSFDDSNNLWLNLKMYGYIDADGFITESFDGGDMSLDA